ncbi:MAG TPA: DUF6398 domain-containing protein [Tepidisphaeraceae bacterium]|nr:DUF6398 domain-containing protein [Tepidisphaeraceae bacterium]
MMDFSNADFEAACRKRLDSFFETYHDPAIQRQTHEILRSLLADGRAKGGAPEGWAAGIVYAVANQDRQPCGMPGLLNSEFSQFFGVSMQTIRSRAARVAVRVSI